MTADTTKNPMMVATGRVAALQRKSVTRERADGTIVTTPVTVPEGALEEARRQLQIVRMERCIAEVLEPTEEGYVPLSLEDRRELANRLVAPDYRVYKRKS